MLESMVIRGGRPLKGEVVISGAKNLALPALVLGLLSSEPIVFRNVPNLDDVSHLCEILSHIGAEIKHIDSNALSICTKELISADAPYDFVRKMRASILVLGPLVGRFGKAKVSLPGGCAIGARGVDLHLKALEALGTNIEISDGYIIATAPKGLVGSEVVFNIPTVTGTENIMMAACFAKGTTTLINCAMEPEISALANYLNNMGAKISGIGSPILTIEGVKELNGCELEIIPDRIETGTYAIAAAITGGDILLKNCRYDHLVSFFDSLQESGSTISRIGNDIRVSNINKVINPVDVETMPYPGFPTDLQAQFCALMSFSNGTSCITETIFENRFMHIPELSRMGAKMNIKGRTVIIEGVPTLNGASVMATDLRASVSLVLAGLAAHDVTTVNRLYHIDRGYENIDKKLRGIGADLERQHQAVAA